MRVDGNLLGLCTKTGKLVSDMIYCPLYYYDDHGAICLPRCESFKATTPLAEVVYSSEDGEIYDFYDEVETIENCTVQILKNSKTGQVSVGWWRN